MTTLTTTDLWLILALAWAVVIGYGLWELFDHCRRVRTHNRSDR